MEIVITAIHCEVSESVKDYVREKVAKLDKYFVKERKTAVTIHAEQGNNDIELICHAHQHTFTVHVNAEESVQEGIDLAVDKMSKQLRRFKGKVKSHKGRDRRQKLSRDIKNVTQRLQKLEAIAQQIEREESGETDYFDKYDEFLENEDS